MADNTKLNNLLATLNKAKPGSIVRGSDIQQISVGSVATGLHNFDLYTEGGFRRSKITHVYGESQAGKSSFMLHTIGYNQRRDPNFTAVVINLEGYWNQESEYPESFGVDMDRLFIINNQEHETSLDMAKEFIKARAVDFLVVDSIAAVIPSTETEKSFGDNNKTAARASVLETFCRRLTSVLQTTHVKGEGIVTNPCAVVFLNQMRSTITKYGAFQEPASAKAVKYFCDTEVRLAAAAKDNQLFYKFNTDVYDEIDRNDQSLAYKNQEKIGKVVDFELTKARGSSFEGKFFSVPFYFKELKYPSATGFMGRGFDEVAAAIDAAVFIGLVEKKGAWIKFLGESFHGEDSFIARVRVDDSFRKTLYEEVGKHINGYKKLKKAEFEIGEEEE